MVDRSDWTVRSKKNPYFAKENHIRLAKGKITKSLVDFSLVPPVITATIQPALAPLLAGATIEDALSADIDQTSNYQSSAGTITSVTVNVLVNGETPAALDIPLDWQDEVSVTVTVQDDASNERVFSLARTVGALAPDPFGPADWAVVVGDVPTFETPADLFVNDEEGFYLRASTETLFTDTAGTTAVTPTETAALWLDESGNDVVVEQATEAERPEYQDGPDRLIIASGKRMQADIPAVQGTMIIATDEGTAAYGVDISSGNYPVGQNEFDYFPGGEIMGQVLIDRELTAQEIENVRQFYIERGAGDDYSNVTSFQNHWRLREEITEFPLINASNGTNFRNAWRTCTSLTSFPELDVSNGTNFREAWRGCDSLINFPELDFSSATTFQQAWQGCESLTSFPAGMFDSVTATTFNLSFGDTNLTTQSIDNILVSIEKAGTSNGTFDQSGGSAPSSTGEAAIDALVARGWTVNVTGGYTPS